MKVVILCGGRGTRLREETEYRPKPMVPIGPQPILWHIMKYYAHFGHTEFILCLGYKGEMIKEYFRNYRWMGGDVSLKLGSHPSVHFHDETDEEAWSVTLAETGADTMTGGRVRRIRRHLGDDKEFFLTYGDGVGNIDIAATLAYHRQHGKMLTVTAVHPPGRFGELKIETSNTVSLFNEKPQIEGGWVSGGYFVASAKIFDYLGTEDSVTFEQEPVRRIASQGQLMGYRHTGFWQPMDTYQEFMLLNKLWAENRAPWKVW